MIRGLFDVAVGLGLFLVTWVLAICLKVGFGLGMGLFGGLGVGQLVVGLM